MGRFPQPEAKRGSQKWIQKLVNEKPEILNSKVLSSLGFSKDEHVEWLLPLKRDNYAEYRDEAFLNLLDIKLEKIPLEKFWPKGGPQWDALAKTSTGKLLLVEAKSHISELVSRMQAEDEGSKKMIRKSLKETKRYLNSRVDVDWSQCFYQYTNRLAHLYLLRENDLPAYLVFVYFVNDKEMKGPTNLYEWKGAIELLNLYLGIGRNRLQKFIINAYIDVHNLQ